MYKFWYYYVNYYWSKYGENAKLYYIGTNSFIVHFKTDDVNKTVAEYVETRFGTSNFKIDRSLPKGKKRKLRGLLKDELGGQITKDFVELRAKRYRYLKDAKLGS